MLLNIMTFGLKYETKNVYRVLFGDFSGCFSYVDEDNDLVISKNRFENLFSILKKI